MAESIPGFEDFSAPAATTCRERSRYVADEIVERALNTLEGSGYETLGQVCYVYGMGGHPRSSYTGFEHRQGVRVVHYESVAPLGLRFVPSYRGLVKIESPVMLHAVFSKLAQQSTAAVYIFASDLETRFIELTKAIIQHRDASFGVKDDPGYLIYAVDEDRDDSPTAMAEFLSLGAAGPWQSLFADR